MTRELGIQFLAQKKNFSLLQGVQTGSKLTCSTVQWVHAAISPHVKCTEHVGDNSSSLSGKIRNMWSLELHLHSPTYLHGVVLNCTQGQFLANVTRIFKIIIILMVNRNGYRRNEMVTVYFKSITTGFIWRNLENHENFLVKSASVRAYNETHYQTSTSYTLFLRVHIKYPYLPNNVVYLRLFWTCSSSISIRNILHTSASVSKWFIWIMNGRRTSYNVVQRPSR